MLELTADTCMKVKAHTVSFISGVNTLQTSLRNLYPA